MVASINVKRRGGREGGRERERGDRYSASARARGRTRYACAKGLSIVYP